MVLANRGAGGNEWPYVVAVCAYAHQLQSASTAATRTPATSVHKSDERCTDRPNLAEENFVVCAVRDACKIADCRIEIRDVYDSLVRFAVESSGQKAPADEAHNFGPSLPVPQGLFSFVWGKEWGRGKCDV